MDSHSPSPPELLAPAGDWDCARAAIENGADAVYFGLDQHNARLRAGNFAVSELPALAGFLNASGVKGYVCLNTLIFADELANATEVLRQIIAAGVDAALVQDLGVCRLIRQLSPEFPIHASTQMSITSAAGVALARELGCHRVVVARECSIADLRRIQEEQGAAGEPPLPLEVFVHGALCVAYSGQCLTSESLGGRSANRGECAQACRMPYDLICDGQRVSLGDRRYLLSPQDLAGLELLPDLIRTGIAAVKIEGRLKTPLYVANVTRVYRDAIDRVCRALAPAPAKDDTPPRGTVPANTAEGAAERVACAAYHDAKYTLEMSFSRGLYTGWLRGIDNQHLVHGRFGKKRGVYLGTVASVQGQSVQVALQAPLQPGDGVVFDAGRPDQDEEGGRVYGVHCRETAGAGGMNATATIEFGASDIDWTRVHPGQHLWKTSDPHLERQWRQSYAGDQPKFRRPLHLHITGALGMPLAVSGRDDGGIEATVRSTMPLVHARRQPLDATVLAEQLGRLGGSAFRLGQLTVQLDGAVMLPISELNRMRRALVAALDRQRGEPRRWSLTATARLSVADPAPCDPAAPPHLAVLVRNFDQLRAALRADARTIYCEFEDPKRYPDAVAEVRRVSLSSKGDPSGVPPREIWVAPPRITKPGEEWILRQVEAAGADGVLVRNYDHLQRFTGARRVGDYSLNVANPLTAEYLLRRFGLERLTASYDLNVTQLTALLKTAPPAWFEITIHQHMPMFHMEHCVFCAFLSKGTDYRDCGRPCEKHNVQLRDRAGAAHPVKADAGCRNTVFNALAQTGAEVVAPLLTLGARHFRLEFLEEPPLEVERTIAMYRLLLRGEMSGTQLWKELKLWNQLGVTRGPLQQPGRQATRLT